MAIRPQEETKRTYHFPRLDLEIQWAGYTDVIYGFKVKATSRTGEFEFLFDGPPFTELTPQGYPRPPAKFDYTTVAGFVVEDLIRTKNLSFDEYVEDKARFSGQFTKAVLEEARQLAEKVYAVSAALTLDSLEEIYAEIRELWREEVPPRYRPPRKTAAEEEAIRSKLDPERRSPVPPPRPAPPRREKPKWRK